MEKTDVEVKVWVDFEGGLHYHKKDCRMVDGRYTEVALKKVKRAVSKYGGSYRPCPLCFRKRRG